MAYLSISLFGGFDATLDGQTISAFGTDKARALLAYLTVELGAAHSRQELAALFWPESPRSKAAHNLSQTLLRLCRALREDEAPATFRRQPFLLVDRHTVQFNALSNYHLDVGAFQELIRAYRQHRHASVEPCRTCLEWLQQAVSLYRGDLLAGFALRDSLSFEEWQLLHQEAFHRQAVEALSVLASYHEGRGEATRVVDYARRLVGLEPWQEQAQIQLMTALAQCGHEAAALEQYVAYSRTLATEFGTAPSAEAAHLYQQILTRQIRGENPSAIASKQGAATNAGERRQVTALVCGGAVPAGQVDPEDLHTHLLRCSQTCTPILDHWGGQRQPRQGADCLVYFGFPLTYEDAVHRAAQAALALAAAQPVCVGIHTEMMALTDGELVGTVPDLARGCRYLAHPHSIVATAETIRLLTGRFNYHPLGLRSLPGVSGDVFVYRLLSENATRSSLTWSDQTQRLTCLVGREQELGCLTDCLERVRRGQGQVVVLSGEPGVGKSRLVQELAQLDAGACRWCESRCLSSFQNTALYPFVRLFEDIIGIQPDDGPQARQEKLDSILTQLGLAEPATAWLLAIFLGLPTQPPAPETITDDLRERMRLALLLLIGRLAVERPLVLVFEDLHWADPSTLVWLTTSLEVLAAAGCLVLLTHRPGFNPPWCLRQPPLQLHLGPLAPEQVALMVADLAGEAIIPEDVLHNILSRCDGVPFYAESLTHAWLEADDRAWQNEIPVTLRDSLLAQLQRAGPAWQTVGWAATLGREFSFSLLAGIVPYDEKRLRADLGHLAAVGVLHLIGPTPNELYAFKHALIQEAALAALLKHERRSRHQRIAETYITRFQHITETEPELVAEHFDQAGLPTQAADFWLLAGKRATRQGALIEAQAFFERVLNTVDPQDHNCRWQALQGREEVFFLAGNRAAETTDIAALLEMARQDDNQAWLAEALYKHLRYLNAVGDFPGMLAVADDVIRAAHIAGNPDLEARALTSKAVAQTRLDDPEAQQTAEAALAQAQVAGDGWAIAYATGLVALYHAYAGDFAGSAQLWASVLGMVRCGGDRSLQSRVLSNLGAAYQYLGLFEEATRHLEEGVELCDLIGDRHSHAYNVVNLAGVKLLSGDLEAATQLFDQALTEATAVDDHGLVAGVLWELGSRAVAMGDYDAAVHHLQMARQTFTMSGMTARVMETEALLAKCALAQGRAEEAQQTADQVWRHLQEHGVAAMDEAVSTYLTLASVFEHLANSMRAQKHDQTAAAIRRAGYALVVERAAKISNPLWRHSFLYNVPSNRAMVECRLQEQPMRPSDSWLPPP